MKKTILSLAAGMVGLAALVQLSGCFSLIGYQMGAAIDRTRTVEKTDLGDLEEWDSVTLHTRNSLALSGRYRGLVRMPAESYTRAYESAKEKSEFGILLPAMEETIFVVDRKGNRREVKFMGFGMNGRNGDRVEPIPKSDKAQALDRYYISFKKNGGADELLMYLCDVKRIAGVDGDVIEGKSIAEMMHAGDIPLRTAVAVDTVDGVRFVGLDDVEDISAEGREVGTGGRVVGTGIGLMLDIAAVGLAVYGISQIDLDLDWGNNSSDYNDSCYDGDPNNDYFCCDVAGPGGVQSLVFIILVFALLLRRAKAYSRSR